MTLQDLSCRKHISWVVGSWKLLTLFLWITTIFYIQDYSPQGNPGHKLFIIVLSTQTCKKLCRLLNCFPLRRYFVFLETFSHIHTFVPIELDLINFAEGMELTFLTSKFWLSVVWTFVWTLYLIKTIEVLKSCQETAGLSTICILHSSTFHSTD